MKKFPSRGSVRFMARASRALRMRKAVNFTALFAVLLSTFTFVNQSPARAATVGSGLCTQTVTSETGVSVTQSGNDCIVTFVSGTNNNWTVPNGVTTVRALVVGGGGGGGAWVGGGGGGGGFRDVSSIAVTPGSTVAVTVGLGGTPAVASGGVYNNVVGTNGGESKFGTILAAGGGKGGSHDPTGGTLSASLKPTDGGSGGGGTGRGAQTSTGYVTLSTGALGNTPSTSPSQGNAGGNGHVGSVWVAGGGGGAGGAGGNATSTSGGAGGAGASSDITGSTVFYAGGGGGILYSSSTGAGMGGSGGGGNGTANGTGISGTANTGGGGGGGGTNSNTSTGGSGGSGIVVIRYTVVETAGTGSCQQSFSKSGTGTVTVAEANNFCYLAFRNTGAVGTQTSFTLRKPSLATSVDYLVVGGGGGGALRHGGGGGAGGLLKGSLNVSSLSELSLKVGNGGSGATTVTASPNNYGPGLTGQDSSLQTVVAKGGGGGNTGGSSDQVGLTGGSGGGALAVNAGGAATSGQGFAGAGGVGGVSPYPSGGGGGAGGAGAAGSGTAAGTGGAGAIWDASFTKTIAQNLGWPSTSAQFSGDQVFFAGGGGGGVASGSGSTAGTASAGGGAGSNTSGGSAGLADSGGGGGGSSCCTDAAGGNGGSGIVIIRYALATQSALSITTTTSFVGAPLSLATSGGSGSGAVTYAVTNPGSTGCSVSGSTLSFTSAGTCSVTATKASADGYAEISSSATAITISNYTATFDSKGGSSVTSSSFGASGSIAEPTAPTRTGYTFAGWSATDGGTAVTWPYSPGVNSNITLYAKWTANQSVDYALELAGTAGQYGQVSGGQIIPATGAFTVSSWFKPGSVDSNNASAVLFSQGTGSNRIYLKRNTAGTLIFYRDTLGAETNCGTAPANVWSHVAITYNGSGTSTCYLNGTQISQLATSASIGTGFVVGSYSPSPNLQNYTWKGSIDEVRVYNTARTASQIAADAHAYATITDSSLVAYYDFNEGSGTSAVNQKYAAAANTSLTLSGAPTWSDIAETTETSGITSVTFPRSYLNNMAGWATPANVTTAQVLVVAGGGGGGDSKSQDPNRATGGSGGAGGYFSSQSVPVSGRTAVVVGFGGTGAQATNTQGINGGDSRFGTLKVGGGGGGNSYNLLTATRALAGNGGTDYVSGGNGGGGRSLQGLNNLSITGGLGGNYASGGINFNGTTFTGHAGVAGSSGGGDFGSGGLGGQIAEADRTSAISGTSTIYAKRGPYLAWSQQVNNPQTFGSGGSTNYNYGSAETSGNTFGGNGAQGVVIVAWQSGFNVTYDANATQHQSGVTTGSLPSTATVSSGATYTVAAQGALARQGFTFAGWNTRADGTGTTYTAGSGSFTVTGNVTLYAKWEIPQAARLIGANETVTSITGGTSNVRGIATDGTYLYVRTSSTSPAGQILKLKLDGTIVSSHTVAGLPATENLDLSYSRGCLYIRSGSANAFSTLNCIDVTDWTLNPVTLPSDKNLLTGTIWLYGNLIDFPDGRIGAVSGNDYYTTSTNSTLCPASATGATMYCKVLRLYNVTGTGKTATYTFSEDIILADTVSGWPNDDHGIATDGTYLYQIRHASGYKVWALQSGRPSQIVFNGDGADPCGSTTGVSNTYCRITPTGITNATYFAHSHTGNFYLVGDYGASKFYKTASAAPPEGPGSAASYTVTFNSKGGSAIASSSFFSGGSLSRPDDPTRIGYTFNGWTATDGGSTLVSFPYSPGVDSNITLYAKWTADVYTLTYNYNNATGGNSTPTSSFTVGGTAITLPTPTKTGYTFAGWYEASDLSGSALGSTYSPTQSRTIYAKWTANVYTITYNYDNATDGNTTTSANFTVGGSALVLPTPTKTGYNFAGWFSDSAKTISAGAAGASYSPTASGTLYAKWTEKTFTITYNVNGATGSPERATDTYTYTGGAVALAGVGSMAKTGYTFDGWQVSGTTTKLTSPYTPTANVTLQARWAAASYKITYFSNSGGTAPNFDTYTTDETAITLPAQGSMARTGYTFNGWSTTINNVATKVATTLSPTAPVNLYALWTPINYTVTYCEESTCANAAAFTGDVPVDSSNYNIGNTVLVKANTGNLVRTGYSFAGWTVNQDGTGTALKSGETYTVQSSNINFYPQWSANTYTITYNANGATGDPARLSDSYTTGEAGISLPNVGTMSKTGYTFAGWSTSSTGSVLSGAFTTTSDVTLNAIWTIKSITYSYNRGTANLTPVTQDETISFPSTLNQSAQFNSSLTLNSGVDSTITVGSDTYKFFGWSDGNATYSRGASYVMPDASPITFTATWQKLYSVRYALNGGTNLSTIDSECLETGYTCTFNQPITLSGAPTREGYTFAGWRNQANTETKSVGASVNVTDENYLWYAQWTAIDYTMTFDSKGGTISNANQTKNIGQSFTFPSPGIKTGYDFNGWVVRNTTSPTYGAGTTFVTGSTGITFDASWTPKTYTVTYNWNGGVGAATNPASYTVDGTAITLPTGTNARDGYVFDGWQVAGTTTKLSSPYAPTANTLLEARWLDGAYVITFDAFNNTGNTNTSVTRATALTLPTPTRTGFTFDGWYEDADYTLRYGAGGASVTPTASKTLTAKWVQNSLVGINPAHLNQLIELNAVSGSANTWTGSHALSNTGAALTVPADALPAGTKVRVSFVEDLTRPGNLIDGSNAYFTSVVVHWLTGSGETATVPDAASGKPLSLKLTNPAIVAGAKVFKIVNGAVAEVATATVDGEVTITFTQDPEFVVAATRPGSPTAVTATNNQNAQSTISWNAPLGTGGSSITGYTVTASPGTGTCTTTGTSCQITGLTNNTTYTFTVKATNAIGDSLPSSPSSAITPRLAINYNVTFNSNGGSPVADSSFVENGTLGAPTDPTRSGYNFIGWATTDGNESTIVSFPYSPANSDLTLYAIWRASNPARNPDNSGNNNDAVITPISASKSATPKASSTPKASGSAKPASSPSPSASQTTEATPKPSQSATSQSTAAPKPNELFESAPRPNSGIEVPQTGEANVLVGDEVVKPVITITEFAKQIEIGDSISISFQATDAAGNQLPTSPDGSVQVVQGASIGASGNGFKPNSPVEAWLYSTPVLLGSGPAKADGTFDNTYAIDSDFPLGDHTVVLHGVSPDDEVITLALGVTVIADEAATDSSSNTLLLAILAFLGALLTAGLWLVMRRRNGAHKK